MPNLQNEPEWLFPFEFMEVGQSFFIPTMQTASMLHAIESGAKRSKIKVRAYITIKDKHIGVRAWRVS